MALNCKDCTVTRNNFTGEIINVEWKGLTNIKPMFIDVREIAYVYQILEVDGDKE